MQEAQNGQKSVNIGDAGNNNQIAITQAYNIQHMHIHLFRTCHEYTEVNQ